MKEEAQIIYTYLRYYLLHEQQEAWDFIMSKQFACEGNLLRSFVRANIGLNFRKSEVALATLKAAEKLPHYSSFPIFEYEMGTALLFNLNDGAVNSLYRFVTVFKGKYYVKEALYKMALSYYLQHNMEKARAARALVPNYGAKTTDADKQAERLSKRQDWPAYNLVQAHELFDGGHYLEALSKLVNQKSDEYTNPIDKVEYYYRMGRIYDETNQPEKAISFYKYAVVLGSNREEYFASRAAFQMGLIYEKQGKRTEALKSFKECIAMKNHDYKASIDQQAKAAINRLGE
jgi:tetratricopeptide (TPR) repeat protein